VHYVPQQKGRRMRRSLRWVAMLVTCMGLALIVGACGSDNNKKSSSAGATGTTPPQGAKQGGHLTFLAASDVDYIDPGQTYYTFGYMVHYATQRTLYSFKPEDSVNPVPDLATGKPEISSDNKTITVHIRKGVKFSPPVNREVTSKDIKYAFERSFTKQVPSGYAGTYFGQLVGAPEHSNTTGYKPISGIETPDDQTIVFHLQTPVAVSVAAALVMPITTPVPKEYAQKFDQKSPTTYDQHVVFTGPYMVKNDASGKLVGRSPGKKIEIVRNPNWDKSTDYRPAYLDSITIDEGNTDLTVASRRTLNGSDLLCCDAGQPPPAVTKQAVTKFKSQVAIVPSGGTRWIALNTREKPFDNLNIRKALIAISDRNALRLTRGGPFVGDIATGWIPPGIPGFEESGGLNQGSDQDYMKNPNGDPAVAKKYMLAAKQDDPSLPISADGKWTGGQKFLTIATNASPGKETSQVAEAQFAKLGFKLNLREVPQDTLYTKFCGVPKQEPPVCPNVGWFKDFSDPESMLSATFNGKNILAQGNTNWSLLNDPKINDAMKKASTIPAGTDRNKAWADINKMIIAQAPAIPYIWDKTITLASKDVNQVDNGYFTTQDLSFTSLK
jgi:peptide/nickel transport system substrate-binding protein